MISKNKQKERLRKAQINEGGGYPIQQASPKKPFIQWASTDNILIYQKLEEILQELKKLNR